MIIPALIRRLFRRPLIHIHDWEYHPRDVGGRGVVECRTCHKWDLY